MNEDKLIALIKSLYAEVKSMREELKQDIKAECRNIEEKLIGLVYELLDASMSCGDKKDGSGCSEQILPPQERGDFSVAE